MKKKERKWKKKEIPDKAVAGSKSQAKSTSKTTASKNGRAVKAVHSAKGASSAQGIKQKSQLTKKQARVQSPQGTISVGFKKPAAEPKAKLSVKKAEGESKSTRNNGTSANERRRSKGDKEARTGKSGRRASDFEEQMLESDDVAVSDEIQEYAYELELVEDENEEEGQETASAAATASPAGSEWSAGEVKSAEGSDEVVLTDAEGRRYCRAKDCDQVGMVDGYCRYHYLLLWKKIQIRRRILMDGKLARYVEELTSRYPDKFLEVIRKDLRTEKDFLAAIQELEIDESAGESDFEEDTNFIDEVRTMGEGSASIEEDEY